MWIEKFRAATLEGALSEVRTKLGPGALILSTKRVRQPGLLGWLGRQGVEIAAAAGGSGPTSAQTPAASRFMEELKRAFPGTQPPLRSRGESAGRTPQQLAVRAQIHRRLVNHGVRPELARLLVNRAAARCRQAGGVPANTECLNREVKRELVRALGFPQPVVDTPGGRAAVAVLVGAPGAGKTTVASKLAAHYATNGRAVELVSYDRHRPVAAEELCHYARALGVPVHEVGNAEEALQVANDSTADLLVVDTFGCGGSGDSERVDELSQLLAVLDPAYVLLCVRLTTREAEASKVAKKMMALGANRLLFTGLDEVDGPGLALNLRSEFELPLSYTSTGHRVPGDFAQANAHELADRLLR